MSPAGRRFWLTLATLAAMALTASLGRWQLHRAAEKEALQSSMQSRSELPVLDARSALGLVIDPELLYRRAEARGTWIAARTVALDNRPMGGQPGFFIVTPLELEDHSGVLLVQRGWVPRNAQDRTRLPPFETPSGIVTVRGRLAPPPSRLFEMGEAELGPIRQNLDLSQFRIETGLALAACTLQETGPASEGLSREWPTIDTGVERHYGYAFQWFALCALMAILYVWFQFVRRPGHNS